MMARTPDESVWFGHDPDLVDKLAAELKSEREGQAEREAGIRHVRWDSSPASDLAFSFPMRKYDIPTIIRASTTIELWM